MQKTLRKSTAPVSITYKSGGFSNNLFAGPSSMDERNGFAYLILDFSGNLHVRNKRQSCYEDACELADRTTEVRTFQINGQIIKEFAARVKLPSDKWRLEIFLAEKGTFTYSVLAAKPDGGGGAFLDVQVLEKE